MLEWVEGAEYLAKDKKDSLTSSKFGEMDGIAMIS